MERPNGDVSGAETTSSGENDGIQEMLILVLNYKAETWNLKINKLP